MLYTFDRLEELDHKFSPEDIKVIEWLLIELAGHRDMKNPITSKQIIRRKSQYDKCYELHNRERMGHTKNSICPHCDVPYKDHYKLTDVKVRSMIHALRHLNYPVGSRGNGYYWITSSEEADTTITHLQQRINSIQEVVDDLHRIRRNLIQHGDASLKQPEEGQLNMLLA